MKKECTKCGARKSRGDFYANCGTADGLLSQCKSCVRDAQRLYRARNSDKIKAYDRARKDTPQHREAVKARTKKLRSTDAGRATLKRWADKWSSINKLKRAAETAVSNAIRDGRLIKQPCERCGVTKHIHAHHEDYSKPLSVNWLCSRHHGERHREINAAKRSLT